MSVWHLYLVRAADGSLYTGIAVDPQRRLAQHASPGGRGAKYLRSRSPLELALSCPIGDRSLALRVEHRVKRLTRAGKEELLRLRPDPVQLLEFLEIDEDEI